MAASEVFAISLGVTVALGSLACAESPKQSNVAVSQTRLTSADTTTVSMQPPAGYRDRPPLPRVATPFQREMEEEQRNPPPSMQTSREWASRYPFPSRMLREWSQEHPRAAADLALWEHDEPDHVRVLVQWAVTSPYDDVNSFLMNRQGWDELMIMRDRDPQAVAELLHIVRAAPKAVEELVLHSPGIGPVLSPPKKR
jgi:hypothetical protein